MVGKIEIKARKDIGQSEASLNKQCSCPSENDHSSTHA